MAHRRLQFLSFHFPVNNTKTRDQNVKKAKDEAEEFIMGWMIS